MNSPKNPKIEWNDLLKAAHEIENCYHIEWEKNKKLFAELELTKHEVEALKTELKETRSQFRKHLNQLREETERLKSIYPLSDLLAAKQSETKRLKNALKLVAKDHPERAAIEALVKAHIVERDEIRWIIQEAESRFQLQLDRIRTASFHCTEEKDSSITPHTSGDTLGGNRPPDAPTRVPEY